MLYKSATLSNPHKKMMFCNESKKVVIDGGHHHIYRLNSLFFMMDAHFVVAYLSAVVDDAAFLKLSSHT